MKKPLFKITRSFAALFSSVALIGGMASCFQEQVQGDIASLQDIISKLDSSVTVNNVVDNGDGSWTINFSDGTSITIRNGQDGEDGLTPPSITVVEEDGTYYWAYENADGTTDFILDDDGNKIPVSGEAPQVRINPDSGNWEISTDGTCLRLRHRRERALLCCRREQDIGLHHERSGDLHYNQA